MNVANPFRPLSYADASLICEDSEGHLTIKIEQQAISQLSADLNSVPRQPAAGVLLGTMVYDGDRASIEIGACPLLNSALPVLPDETGDELRLAAELKNYPRATPRAPGCVGYFRVAAIGEHGPTEHDQELFSRRFAGPLQIFLFARKREDRELSPHFYVVRDGHLVPLAAPVVQRGASSTETLVPLWPVDLSKRRFWAVSAVAVTALASGLLYYNRARTPVVHERPARFTITPAFPEAKSFQLTATRENNSLTLLWDSEAAVVRSAQKGVLVIEDGQREAQQTLDPADLRSGKLVYVPSHSNVRFRMDLVSQTGAVETASIRVLGLAPRSLAQIVDPSTKDADAFRSRTKMDAPPSASSDDAPTQLRPVSDAGGELEVDQPLVTAAIRSTPPETTPAVEKERKQVSSAPSPIPVAFTKPTSTAETQTNLIAQQTLPSPAVTPVVPTEMPPRLLISQATQEPRVKTKTNPSIPLGLQSMLRSRSRAQVVIPVRVRIGTLGEVTSAHADLSPGGVLESQLANIAATTARYWTFYPATIDGRPVSSELVINFKF
jgi:hypothetical protein